MNINTTFASRIRLIAAAGLLGLLAACSTVDRAPSPELVKNASWAVLPFENHTETPMAGSRAESKSRTGRARPYRIGVES